VLRAYDYGLLTMLLVALAYGLLWSVVGLGFGLVAIGAIGGWLIGYNVKRGVLAMHERERRQTTLASDESLYQPWPRGTSTLAALLGLMAWIVGAFVAFVVVQLVEGTGPLLERLTPGNFGAYLTAVLEAGDMQLIQSAALAAFIFVGWVSARAPKAVAADDERR
jgi:hypothetical protein